MVRPIWRGAISFGLVTVPVALYSATEDHTIHFHQFQRGTSDRIRYRRVNERTGEEVDYSDIVKGHQAADGEHVLLDPKELEEVAPGRSRTVEIDSFVDLSEIDPIYFQRTYWLAPSDEKYEHAYALLCRAMARTNRVGMATFVMRSKQYLCVVRADHELLSLSTLFFSDEIRDPARTLPSIPKQREAKGKELDMAVNLIESMTVSWRPQDYRDTYTERVEQLVEDKRQGRETVTASEPARTSDVVDLTDALRRSVKGSRGGARRRGEDLSALNKSQLEARARELGVPGRSRMTRDELEEAVGAAGSRERRKRAS